MTACAPAKVLRQLLSAPPIVVAPGVYDALSAWLAVHSGFPAVFVSGSALAYTRLARPDVNLLTLTEVTDAVARIRERVSVPIIADADSGHGNAANVQRTVRLLERAGASAIQIEDQLNSKPANGLATRPLVSLEEMIGKIKAAQDARDHRATLISARTDAMFSAGFDEALRRAVAFKAAGADVVFVEGLNSLDQMQQLRRELGDLPRLHNILDGGKSPIQTSHDAQALGYAIVLFPGAAVQAAATAMADALRQLRQDGATDAFRGGNLDGKALNELIETPRFLEESAKYADS